MYVYILKSITTNKYYCGQTKDLENRLNVHNSGRAKYTKHGTPWVLVHQVKVENRKVAVQLERKIKNRGIQRFLEDSQFGV